MDIKNIYSLIIFLVFITCSLLLYLNFNENLDATIKSGNFSSERDKAGYQSLEVKVTNNEESFIQPAFYLGDRGNRGMIKVAQQNTSKGIPAGETSQFSLEPKDSNYIEADYRTTYTLVVMSDGKYTTETDSVERRGIFNPQMLNKDNYANWQIVKTDPKDGIKTLTTKQGIKARFQNCSKRKICELEVYQKTKPEKFINLEAKTDNLKNQTEIGVLIQTDKDRIKRSIDAASSRIKKTVNIEEIFSKYKGEPLDIGVYVHSTQESEYSVNITRISSYSKYRN